MQYRPNDPPALAMVEQVEDVDRRSQDLLAQRLADRQACQGCHQAWQRSYGNLHRLELDLAQAPALARGAGCRRWKRVRREHRRFVKDEGRQAIALGDGASSQRVGEPSLLSWNIPQPLLRLG